MHGTGGVGRRPRPESLDELEAEFGEHWRRSRALVRRLARDVDPDLDPAAWALLVQLDRAGSMPAGELAATLLLDKSTLSRQVDATERLGLTVRTRDPDDARVRRVELTEDGVRRVAAVRADQRRRWRRALADWPDDDVRALARLLHRLGESGFN